MAMAGCSSLMAYKALFSVLGCLMVVTLVYTIFTDGSPFRRELLTPWMVATLIDFYVNVVAISAWVVYKESTWISAVLWIIFLVCFGSITTCAYIVKKLGEISSHDPVQNLVRQVFLSSSDKEAETTRGLDLGQEKSAVRIEHSPGIQRLRSRGGRIKDVKTKAYNRIGSEGKIKDSSILFLKILFSMLGLLVFGIVTYTLITDGSPFRMELLTPWMTATLIDFYINVVAISVWVIHKESSWISAFIWIVFLICFGSITTCVYIVLQLFQLSCQDQNTVFYSSIIGTKQ